MNAEYITTTIAVFVAIITAAKIIGKSIEKSASNPTYEFKFELGEQTMTKLENRIEEVEKCVADLDKTTSLCNHGINNILQRMLGQDSRLDKLFEDLRHYRP